MKDAVPEAFPLSNDGSADRRASKGATWTQFLAAMVLNLNTFAYGNAIAWPAMALPQLQSANSTVADLPLTEDEGSWVAGLQSFGAIFGTPLYAVLLPHVNRKLLAYLVFVPLELCWIIKLCSASVPALYAARLLAGLNASGSLILVSAYISEIASDEVRGALGSLFSLMANVGILFSYIIGAYCSYSADLWIQAALPIVFAVAFFFMPETPYRLLSLRRREDAAKALRWLRRGASEDVIEAELSRIESSLGHKHGDEGEAGEAGGASLREMLKTRRAIVGVSIVVVLCANQMLCGLFAVLNYAVVIFHDAGSSLSPEISTIIIAVIQVIGNLSSLPLIDRLGRRIILLLSNLCTALSISMLGAYFFLKTETTTDVSSIGWLPLLCLAVYMLMVAFGLGPLPYVVLSEIVEPRLRPFTSLLGYLTIWVSASIMTKMYPAMAEALGVYGCMWFFASVCVFGTVYGLAMLPETKGRALDDILKMLDGKKEVAKKW